MKTSYISYLRSINNSLIRDGIHLPIEINDDMSLSEIESVISVLEPFCYFNDVLTLCDSAYSSEVVADCKAKLYTDVVKEEVLAKYKESFDSALRLLYADRESPLDKKTESASLADYLSKYNKTTDIESLAVSVGSDDDSVSDSSASQYNDIFAVSSNNVSVFDDYGSDESEDFDYSDEDVEEETEVVEKQVETAEPEIEFDNYDDDEEDSEGDEEFDYSDEEESDSEDDEEFDYSDEEESNDKTEEGIEDEESLIEEDEIVTSVPSQPISTQVNDNTDEDEEFDYSDDEEEEEEFDYSDDEKEENVGDTVEEAEVLSDDSEEDSDSEDFDYSDDENSDEEEEFNYSDEEDSDSDEDESYEDDDMYSEDDSSDDDKPLVFDTPTAQAPVTPQVTAPVKENYEKTAEAIVGIVGYGEKLAKKLVNTLKNDPNLKK